MADIGHLVAKKITALAHSPEEVNARFAEVRVAFDEELAKARDQATVEAVRMRYRGRKGLDRLIRENWLKSEWPLKHVVGLAYNNLKAHIEAALGEQVAELEAEGALRRAETQRIDLTLPGSVTRRGTRHPITQTMEEIVDIFVRLGYSVVEGPEIETSYYNFEALNIPEFHPARDTMDTFYLSPGLLLRTHTSPMQIRVMEKQKPPVRIVVPGKIYRRDNPDASHSFMFHQLEGLVVDRDITFCDLKGTLDHFLREFFGPETRTRFVPSYFPFTEPSADVHASCHVCRGKGCPVCKYVGWIEMLGCGMVHPAVYGFVGYNADELSGFAFGMGLDRFAMVKYGIDDIQLLFQNDVRFLQQFQR